MKFQLLSDEIEIASKRELEREIISEGEFHFIKKSLSLAETQKNRFNFFRRKPKQNYLL